MDGAEITASEIQRLPRTVASLERLVQVLGDGASTVRSAAARALSEIPDARAAEALVQATEDEHPLVRYWAAVGLQRHGDRIIDGIIPLPPELAEEAERSATISGQLPLDTPAEAAAAARAIRERLARTGRRFSDSTELIREDRDR